MAEKNKEKAKRGEKRRARVRGKIFGTAERPRLTVCKSLKNITAQVINDEETKTIAAASSLSKNVISELKDGMTKTEMATVVGEIIAREAKEKGVETVVFDRNRHRFHGRIKAVADAARKAGLKL